MLTCLVCVYLLLLEFYSPWKRRCRLVFASLGTKHQEASCDSKSPREIKIRDVSRFGLAVRR